MPITAEGQTSGTGRAAHRPGTARFLGGMRSTFVGVLAISLEVVDVGRAQAEDVGVRQRNGGEEYCISRPTS